MSPWLSDLLLRSQTDERLIALAQLGHKRAFELIVERYRRPLTAHARRIDPHRAEDLVQQTFLAALSALQGGTEVRHLSGWLHEILRNQARREYATSATLAELDEADSVTESAQQVAERRMLAVDALGAVAGLPARQHDAIVQMAFHGQSRTEVANSMGLSEGAVRQLVHRARAAVRTAVTAITPMPIVRWLYTSRSGSATGVNEIALGAGTASGAGIALKVSVGAIVASGVVAGGVISAVSPHHRTAARLASHSQSADSRSGAAGAGTIGAGGAERTLGPAGRAVSGPSTGRGQGPSGTRARFSLTQPSARVGGDGSGSGRDGGSQSGSRGPGGRDGSASSGPGSGDGGGSSGSSGPGSGDRGGSSGSDGGGTQSGSGSDGGGGSSTSDGGLLSASTSGSTDGGGGSQPRAVTSGDGGGTPGGDGGLTGSGTSGSSSTSDGGSLISSSGSGSGSSGGSSSDTGSSSDGGSSSLDGSTSTTNSASGSTTSDGH